MKDKGPGEREDLPSGGQTVFGGQLARNTLLNLAGLGLPLAIGLVTVPFVIRGLGTERFGILTLVWVIFGYFGMFDLGLATASTKHIAEFLGRGENHRVSPFLWTAVSFQVLLGLAAGALLAALTPWLTRGLLNIPAALQAEAGGAFYWLAASIPVIFAASTFRGALEAGQRFDLANAVKLPSSILNYVLPLAGLAAGMKLPGIVALFSAARAATLAILILLCIRALPSTRRFAPFAREAIRPLFTFGGWITLTGFIWMVFNNLDRFLIGMLKRMDDVSFYTAPYEGITRLGIIPGSLMSALFPTFSTLKGRGETARTSEFFCRSLKYLLLVGGVLSTVVFFFADILLRLWLGADFAAQSATTLRILALNFLVSSVASAPFALLQGAGRASVTAKCYIAEFLFYTPLCWLMIRRWGIEGAAGAFVARSILDMALLLAFAIKLERIALADLRRAGVFRAASALMLIVVLAALSHQFLPGGLPEAAATGPMAILVVWLFALDPMERDLIRRKFGRVLNPRKGSGGPAAG